VKSIFRDACALKQVTQAKATIRRSNRSKGIKNGDVPTLPHSELHSVPIIPDNDKLPKESRTVIRLARDLFTASIGHDPGLVAIIRAKLHCICFGKQSVRNDVSQRRLHAWYYLGLHYDALCMEEQSKWCMSSADSFVVEGSNDLTFSLPRIHMKQRKWKHSCIDDTFGWKEDVRDDTSNLTSSLRASISDFTLKEIQEALRKRGEHYSGKKSILQEVLLERLIRDANAPSMLKNNYFNKSP